MRERRNDPNLVDCFLAPMGIRQAKELKCHPKLAKYEFDLTCTSPLTRALATTCLAFDHLAEEGNDEVVASLSSTQPPCNFIVNADICEIGSKIPENQGRPIKQVIKEVRKKIGWIAPKCLESFDFSLVEDSWPKDTNNNKDRKDEFLQWLRTRKERTIAVVCHYNTIRLLLNNTVNHVPNCHPIECTFSDDGELTMN